MSAVIRIGDRTYHRNPSVDRFQIDIGELDGLRMGDVPPRSHLEILGLPVPRADVESEMWVLHSGDGHEYCVYGGASISVVPQTVDVATNRLRRAFPGPAAYDARTRLEFSVQDGRRGLQAHVYLNVDFTDRRGIPVVDAIAPFVQGFHRLSLPDVRAFICHASEDKPVVRALAAFIRAQGVAVWLDEQEIRVGDSIVRRIADGLAVSSHLIVVLSRHSASKPWVTKELSVALMRQLHDQSVTVLPYRLDDAPIPPLLADIKYADGRSGLEAGFRELLAGMLHADGA